MMPSSTSPRFKKSDPYASSSGELFRKVANTTARSVGHPWSFTMALLIVIGWGLSGPLFHFSDTWQLVINTSTTIVTFLMVFLIQNTQNRDSHAIHLKLDELIYANKRARNRMMDLEELSESELEELQQEFMRFARERELERLSAIPERRSQKRKATSEEVAKPAEAQTGESNTTSSSITGERSSLTTNRLDTR
jgi:low affinity Fe/Cu permease